MDEATSHEWSITNERVDRAIPKVENRKLRGTDLTTISFGLENYALSLFETILFFVTTAAIAETALLLVLERGNWQQSFSDLALKVINNK